MTSDIKAQLRKEIEEEKTRDKGCTNRNCPSKLKVNALKATLSGIEQGEKLERERIKSILKQYAMRIGKGYTLHFIEELLFIIDRKEKQEAGE